jgi:SRSO17 transposase
LRIKLVLADNLYGESHSTFINLLNELQLNYAVPIRSNHGVLLPKSHRVRENRWRKFDRIFADGSQQVRYIRESNIWQKKSC